MGLNPFEAPATFSLMPYSEIAHGVWYPRGGMYRIVEVLMDIARHAGVEFVFDAPVQRIETYGPRAQAVTLHDGTRMDADVILANADLPYVYTDLLPDAEPAEQMAHKQYSCSVISFFWSLDKRYDQLGPHTLFLAEEYRDNFERIDRLLPLPDKPSLYIHAPTRLDPALAPSGEDTLIAIVPVGHVKPGTEQDWKEICATARQAVLRRLDSLGIHDLEAHLKFEVKYSPLSWRKRYNLMNGSTHGLSHTLMQLGYMRPHNRHSRYHNLYFVGASTHPGTGIPTALISARLAAARIVEDLQRAGA